MGISKLAQNVDSALSAGSSLTGPDLNSTLSSVASVAANLPVNAGVAGGLGAAGGAGIGGILGWIFQTKIKISQLQNLYKIN